MQHNAPCHLPLLNQWENLKEFGQLKLISTSKWPQWNCGQSFTLLIFKRGKVSMFLRKLSNSESIQICSIHKSEPGGVCKQEVVGMIGISVYLKAHCRHHSLILVSAKSASKLAPLPKVCLERRCITCHQKKNTWYYSMGVGVENCLYTQHNCYHSATGLSGV